MAFTNWEQSPKVVMETGRYVSYAAPSGIRLWGKFNGEEGEIRLLKRDVTYTERYKYVGLTQYAAEQCSEAMRIKYTKQKMIPIENTQRNAVDFAFTDLCVAEITSRRVGDSIMFEVDVYINDKTTTMEFPKENTSPGDT